jgi:hypothetical protein
LSKLDLGCAAILAFCLFVWAIVAILFIIVWF